jgi:hypothetical protein
MSLLVFCIFRISSQDIKGIYYLSDVFGKSSIAEKLDKEIGCVDSP